MTCLQRMRALRHDTSGSTIIEFGLIGPAMIAMMLGVLQMGVGMKGYNALRSASADVARHATVQYQGANKLTDTQIRNYARAVLRAPPYGLGDQDITIEVTQPTVQRVVGAKELQLKLTYRVPNLITIAGIPNLTLNYTRPIFLLP